ncbi:MATE family efflux transporter [Allocoprobacillus halotolerans]|uniref:Probable multidrug resistance protein NorM n=1 Tax=Allocoprobacillus halotolerans TaxID=2944914 RepID=A0ABY5I4P0_9FIRM|nr:MATE family efflux transporter [Allocoprobacillus halotolerans]UTY39693.1 MATE family efflux transporter [Allocoprobacillus halotolerans]
MNNQLTHGSITKSLILFSIPMIIGNLLQQFYNVADTFIVGQFLGADALAAVGSSFTLMTFLTSIILGLCMGSGILFSMYYGGQQIDKMKTSFFISFIGIALFSILLEILCLFAIHPILHFMNIPQDIYQQSYDYLFIIFIGFFFTFLYNYFSSLLRALGNSKVPLYFLAIASIINVFLDIYLIVSFDMGISGAALATIIAQAISGFGIMIYVLIKQKDLLPAKKHCYFNKDIFMKIKDYSLLTCIQQSVMNFGILMIQGLVNSFGVITMSAFAAAVKIDSFAYMPVQDFGNAFSTFIAQNKGANLPERIQKGLKSAMIISGIFCLFISLIVYIFAPILMLIFIHPEEVEIIRQGVEYLQIEGMCYLGIGYLFLLYGYYRGVGKPGISVVLTIASLGTRVALAYLFAPILGTIAIWWAIPIGWFLADAIGILYGITKEKWQLKKL